MGVHLTVPLRGSGVALAAAGTHELLVNVNGTPAGGSRARLAAARMLLPVLGLPGASPSRTPADPTPLTVLYPIADTPHRIATVPGAPPLLDNDVLAAEFTSTGRLGGLVAALAQRAPAGSPVRAGLCVAIDPDLVETASVMSQGYQVVGPNGAAVAGSGAAAAGQWIAQLAAATKGGCVVALPYADADLVALTRGGLTDAAARALGPGRQILSTVLQTPVPADVAWPADGVVDDPTLDVAQASGARTVLLSADAVTGRARGGVVPLAGRPVAAVLTDPLLTRAATAPLAIPVAPGPGAAATAESLAGDDGGLATQDLIGALAFRANGTTPLVLAPPHQWRTDGAGARALLDAVGALVTVGEVNPVGLTDTVAGSSAPVRPDPPVDAAEVPASAISTVADAARDLTDLRSAVVDGNVGTHGRPAVHAARARAAAGGVGRVPGVRPPPRRTPRPPCWDGWMRSATRSGCWSRRTRTRSAVPTPRCRSPWRTRCPSPSGCGWSSRARQGCGSTRSTSSRSRRSVVVRCR